MQNSSENFEAYSILSDNDRKNKLSEYIRNCSIRGWIVENQSDFNAVLVSGQKCNHILHLLITILGGAVTCGVLLLWIFVWFILACIQHEERLVVNIDQYGQIHTKKV